MTIPSSLLAILAEGPSHGYAIKTRFEQHTAGAWPLNVGQVYTTLGRLERDGLVAEEPGEEEGRRSFRLTAAGRKRLAEWLAEPVSLDPPARDELVIKLLLAMAQSKAAAEALLMRQRAATLERLQRLNRAQRSADPAVDLAQVLLLDRLALEAKAELDWLERSERRLAEVRR